MTKETIKAVLLNAHKDYFKQDVKELTDDTIITIQEMRNVSLDFELYIYADLNEHGHDGGWNELRKNNVVLDMDVPDELELAGWVDYLHLHLRSE